MNSTGVEAARVGAIDSRHRRGVENIDVRMYPKPVEIWLAHDRLHRMHHGLDASLSDRVSREHAPENPPDLVQVFIVCPAAYVSSIFEAEVRRKAVDIADRR
jgi:hypothetical protein